MTRTIQSDQNSCSSSSASVTELRQILASSRLVTSFIAFSLPVLMIAVQGSGNFFLTLLRCTPILFVTMFGFIVNDCFDCRKDKLNGVSRPIATGRLSIQSALKWACILALTALAVEYLTGDRSTLAVILFTIVLVALYSPTAQYAPCVKGIYTAFLCCLPALYGSYVLKSSLPLESYAVILIFIFGRELLLDLRDLRGDRVFGMKTIPFYIGKGTTNVIGWTLMVCAVALLIVFGSSATARVFGIASICALGCSYAVYRTSSYRGLKVTRVAMICAMIPAALLV